MDPSLRERVRQRAGQRCEYCRLRQEYPRYALQVEHVVPRKHGGTDDITNLALACDRCNLHKGSNLAGIDRETAQIVPLFNPRTQGWREHFGLDGPIVVGLSSCGRATATIRVLDMNAPRRVRLRMALLERGELDT